MRIVPIHDGSTDASTEQMPFERAAEAPQWRQRLMCVLWPAFLVAGVAEGVFFTLIDPEDLHVFGATLELSRTAIYTIGFFCLWALGALAAAGTLLLRESSSRT